MNNKITSGKQATAGSKRACYIHGCNSVQHGPSPVARQRHQTLLFPNSSKQQQHLPEICRPTHTRQAELTPIAQKQRLSGIYAMNATKPGSCVARVQQLDRSINGSSCNNGCGLGCAAVCCQSVWAATQHVLPFVQGAAHQCGLIKLLGINKQPHNIQTECC